MTTLQDQKLATLRAQLGVDGHINDLESEWLVALGATAGRSIVDQWFEVFDAAAVPAGHFNDRARTYITAQVGAPPSDDQNEYWRHYWTNATLAPPAPAPPLQGNLQHWFDFSDAATMFTDVAGTVPVSLAGDNIRHIQNKGFDGTPLTQAGPTLTYQPNANNASSAGRYTVAGETLDALMAAGGSAGWTQAALARRTDPDPLAAQAYHITWGGPGLFRMGYQSDGGGRWVQGGHLSFAIDINTQVRQNSGIYHGEVYAGDVVSTDAIATTGLQQVSGGGTGAAVPAGQTMLVGGAFGAAAGDIVEELVWNTKLTVAQMRQVLDYFVAKHGPQAWVPPAQANLIHWFDFNDAQTLWEDVAGTVPMTGLPIARVDNKGSDPTNLTQPTFGLRPQFATNNPGDRASAFLNSAGEFLSGTVAAGFNAVGTGITIGAVLKPFVFGAPRDGVDVLEWNTLTSAGVSIRINAVPIGNEEFRVNIGGNTAVLPVPITTDWYLVYGLIDAVPQFTRYLSPGPEQGPSVSGSAPIIPAGQTLQIIAGNTTFLVTEMWVWDRDLTAGERAALVSFANSKFQTLPHP